MWASLWLLQREGKEEVFSFCKKEEFEFSTPQSMPLPVVQSIA